jgi:hypothetical protein
MSMTNQYLAFGTGGGANTYSYATYAASGVRTSGYQPGLADAQHVNTVLRQCSVAVAALAQFAADYGTSNVNDDGSPTNFEAALKSALDALFKVTTVTVSSVTVGFKIGPFLVQWGTVALATLANVSLDTATFPVAFSAAPFFVSGHGDQSASGSWEAWVVTPDQSSLTASVVTFRSDTANSGSSFAAGRTIRYIAIGLA